MPEPLFDTQGTLRRRAAGELPWRAALLLLKLLALGVLLSAILDAPGYGPFGSTTTSSGGSLPASAVAARTLDALSHLWCIYLWAALCLDVGMLLVLLAGGTTEPPFRNPLLASRTLREAWGERWNQPVHVMLKRAVYRPARQHGFSPLAASLVTFAASGLLHEYNFYVHNHAAYAPGNALAFFVLMGGLMLAEAALARRSATGRWRLLPRLARLVDAMPSAVVATGLQLAVLPWFAPLFVHSWLEAGMLQAVAELVPHVRCA